MGFYRPRVEIHSRLSRRNTRADQIDNLLYEEMIDQIRAIITHPRYAALDPDMAATGIDWLPDDPNDCRTCGHTPPP